MTLTKIKTCIKHIHRNGYTVHITTDDANYKRCRIHQFGDEYLNINLSNGELETYHYRDIAEIKYLSGRTMYRRNNERTHEGSTAE